MKKTKSSKWKLAGFSNVVVNIGPIQLSQGTKKPYAVLGDGYLFVNRIGISSNQLREELKQLHGIKCLLF